MRGRNSIHNKLIQTAPQVRSGQHRELAVVVLRYRTSPVLSPTQEKENGGDGVRGDRLHWRVQGIGSRRRLVQTSMSYFSMDVYIKFMKNTKNRFKKKVSIYNCYHKRMLLLFCCCFCSSCLLFLFVCFLFVLFCVRQDVEITIASS